MSFEQNILQLKEHVQRHKNNVSTEAAVKRAFIERMFNVWGYDIDDPTEIVPEQTADIGAKADKVDYAIFMDNKMELIIEAKYRLEGDLEKYIAQLFKYFSVTDAKIAILTDGIRYLFFSDTKEINKMDLEPFFEINMLTLTDKDIEKMNWFSKENFNAQEIKKKISVKQVKEVFRTLLVEPSAKLLTCLREELLGKQIDTISEEDIKELLKEVLSSPTVSTPSQTVTQGSPSVPTVQQPVHITSNPSVSQPTKVRTGNVIQPKVTYTDAGGVFKRLNHYTKVKINRIMLLGTVHEAKSVRDALKVLLQTMLELHPNIVNDFDKNKDMIRGNNGSKFFSYDMNELSIYREGAVPYQMTNGLYVYTNLSASDMAKFCDRVLLACGYKVEDLLFDVE